MTDGLYITVAAYIHLPSSHATILLKLQVASENVTREEPKTNFVSSVARLLLVMEPIAGEFVGPLYQQPSLMAVDEEVRQRNVSKQSICCTADAYKCCFKEATLTCTKKPHS